MADDYLFCKYDMGQVIESQRSALTNEIDRMADERLLNTDLSELQEYFVEKLSIELPILGEPQVETGRTKMTVGRFGGFDYGRGEGIEVDAERFTLEITFEGDKELFYCRGNSYNTNPPRGSVTEGLLSTTIVERSPNPEQLNQQFDRFIKDVETYLDWLKPMVRSWNIGIRPLVEQLVEARRKRFEQANSIASSLKFNLKSRTDRAASFSAPVQKKKIAPALPPAKPGKPAEPTLSPEAYRDILDTLQQMSEVMERSPHAYKGMDEETLRFQFLVPLNARFEGEARGEVFNFGGKTDILITYRGKNIFVAECKIWTGASALSEAVDQLLGYLCWRDTKAALLIFNRNKSFTNVLSQIDTVLCAHPQFLSNEGRRGETEFAFTFGHPSDPDRRVSLTVLAFDTPAN